jgi:predicted Ser/Thr protein kinase
MYIPNNFNNDLKLILLGCLFSEEKNPSLRGKKDSKGSGGESLFPFILEQISYDTLNWLVGHYNSEVLIYKTAWQKRMKSLIIKEYDRPAYVPEFEIEGIAPPKPNMVSSGVKNPAKVVDISDTNPYRFFCADKRFLDFVYDINVTNRLGKPGKEGTVYFVNMSTSIGTLSSYHSIGKSCAMKVYKSNKSYNTVLKEARFQQEAAKCGVAPKVYAVLPKGLNLDVNGPVIIMNLGGERVVDRIERQGGILTENQQFKLLQTALILDRCGIRQNDPNPLNFMFVSENSDDVLWIDFGFAVKQEKDKINNLISLGNFLRGGMQGLITRKKLKPEGASVITYWVEKASKGKQLSTEDKEKIFRG